MKKLKLTEHNFRQFRDSKGMAQPGLWVSDICRVERSTDGWDAEAPMRQIGRSAYCEFRPVEMGGQWGSIGTYRVREDAMIAAEKLKSGNWVWHPATRDKLGKVPGYLTKFAEIVSEIADSQG